MRTKQVQPRPTTRRNVNAWITMAPERKLLTAGCLVAIMVALGHAEADMISVANRDTVITATCRLNSALRKVPTYIQP
nr:hypothetical protein [Bacillus licheniformis]